MGMCSYCGGWGCYRCGQAEPEYFPSSNRELTGAQKRDISELLSDYSPISLEYTLALDVLKAAGMDTSEWED